MVGFLDTQAPSGNTVKIYIYFCVFLLAKYRYHSVLPNIYLFYSLIRNVIEVNF